MKDVEKFKKFLTESGAVVQPPTNQWEVVRFRTVNGTSVVYENKRGHLTFTGESKKAYQFFSEGRRWKAVDRQRKSLRALKIELAMRDGKKCFFHGGEYSYDQLTIEHLLEFSKGGSDHPYNLCLACDECNKAVVGMTITQKMQYRDKTMRQYADSIVPMIYVDEAADFTEEQWAQLEEGLKSIQPGRPIKISATPAQHENYFAKIFKKGKK